MKIEQSMRSEQKCWTPSISGKLKESAQLVLLFGGTAIIKNAEVIKEVQGLYPKAYLLGCSTAGEICDTQVKDDSLVLTAVNFEHSRVQSASVEINNMNDSFNGGERLAKSLDLEGLTHVFVLSDGLNVNGSDLIRGIMAHLPEQVSVTGGLSGDGARFKETVVLLNGQAVNKSVVAIGLYGSRIKVGYCSLGGWDPFGPDRVVTRSKNNILYELDGESALTLYKRYLGDHAQKLPASGLLFPLSLKREDSEDWIVRTILAVNEEDQSLTFAGDIPEGANVRLMKANFEGLVDGAIGAAKGCLEALNSVSPDLAILISCVGRKMVLKQRVEEEVEGVRNVFGEHTVLTGFYSYGEICPFTRNAKSELHNQTMTITALLEV
ncbi:MAG: FIST N-terminal domain-containing protein [Candidatus Omnitrophota bacterium]